MTDDVSGPFGPNRITPVHRELPRQDQPPPGRKRPFRRPAPPSRPRRPAADPPGEPGQVGSHLDVIV